MVRGEAELVDQKAAVLPANVLLAPHHGSRTSSSPAFLDQVCPQIVVISSGWENRFGFPHSSVIQRYQQRGCHIYRTDQQGAIGIITDGSELHVEGLRNS
jgi:competence protein ComEC